MKTSVYIAEINLPSKSAYSVHVFQMCNFLAKKRKVKLLIPHIEKKDKKKIKKNFGIKYDFEIISIFQDKINLNFFTRLIFSYKCLRYIKKIENINLIISRSIIASLVFAINKIKSYLEIHTELKGVTKFFFLITKFKSIANYLKFIFIHKHLLNYFKFPKKKYLILDDAVNLELFKDKKVKNLNRTCAYFGSLSKGKGIEIIFKISQILKNYNFHIYGDLSLLDKKKYLTNQKNLKYFDHVDYIKIPNLMRQYHILLMPYQHEVSVRSKNLNTAKYMSPLKLFEYLAMSKIILASKLNVYSHILKNNKNAILIDSKNIKEWAKKIILVFKNLKKFKYLRKGALKTAEKHTWEKRVDTILKNNNLF